MRSFTVYSVSLFIVLCIVVLSCYGTTPHSSEEVTEVDMATILSTTEQYFEGNLRYNPDGTFFEEFISGSIVPVNMMGLPFIIETEFPQINRRKGDPVHVTLSGHLSPQINDKGIPELYLTIKKIKDIYENQRHIQPMTGVYKGEGHTLTVSPDHKYLLMTKNGSTKEGHWFLNAKSTMILLSADSKMIMKVNYKKKSLNGKDDNPIIFTLAPTPSSR